MVNNIDVKYERIYGNKIKYDIQQLTKITIAGLLGPLYTYRIFIAFNNAYYNDNPNYINPISRVNNKTDYYSMFPLGTVSWIPKF